MTPARRFQFRLALALGIPNPDVLMAAIPERIYREWLVYSLWEPFGEERADLRSGVIAASVANSTVAIVNALTRGRRRPRFSPRDFMPEFRPPDAPRLATPPEKLLDQVIAMNKAFGGTLIDQRVH